MKYEAKSIVIGRMPREDGCKFKTLFVKIFDKSAPLNDDDFPVKELSFKDTERLLFTDCSPEYYLEGNDLILDNIQGIEISQLDAHSVSLKCMK